MLGCDIGCEGLGHVFVGLHDCADDDDVDILHGCGEVGGDCGELGVAVECAGDVEHRLLGVDAVKVGCILGGFVERHPRALYDQVVCD